MRTSFLLGLSFCCVLARRTRQEVEVEEILDDEPLPRYLSFGPYEARKRNVLTKHHLIA